ncbi:hypothetical protein V6N13_087554 [Hibiscus sabdariffa]
MKLSPEESNQHLSAPLQQFQTGREVASDDDRSVAADSWSIKSDYGSTLDDEQRHADAAEALSSAVNFRPASDYSSDKDESDADAMTSMLGLQSYWDAAYLDELANFREHGHVGEIWFSDLTGTDYSEGAIDLARSLADRDGFSNIKFLVDDILETKLDRQFQLVMDKGTLDAIGLHPDGPIKRMMYWDSVSKLLARGGILVITSCNHTKDELVQEVENFNQRKIAIFQEPKTIKDQETQKGHAPLSYLNHVRTYPTFMFGGSVGSRVATVAFLRN